MVEVNDLPDDVEFARIENELFDRITVRYRRQVVRHRLVALAAVFVIAGAGVAAGTVGTSREQSDLAYCYSAASLSSQVAGSAVPNNGKLHTPTGSRPSAAKVARAVDICGAAWKAGVFGSARPSAPRLRACLQDNLVIAVLPKRNASESADTFCSDLGLSAP